MTTRVIGADTFTLLYDGSLRMVAVQKNGATIAEFAYDGDGRMVTASVGGTTTSYVGGYFEWRVDASGSRAVKYYSAGGTRVAMRQGDTVTYLFGDHLGSTSVAFNDAANATQSQGYTAFGSERYSLGGELPTDYAYTGQKEFETIGLHFYNARWYDGALGRFITADSVVPDKGNPRGLDRYAYVANNPISHIDPGGHCWGFARGMRDWTFLNYGTTCENLDLALTIIGSDETTPVQKLGAGAYVVAEGGAHAAVAIGSVVCLSNVTVCMAGAKTALGIGGAATEAACVDGDCTNEASTLQKTAASVIDKLQRYLLNPDHPVGGSKAKWFEQALGYTKDNLDSLAKQIVFDPSKAVMTEVTQYGTMYNQVITITGANGKEIDVTFAWIKNVDGIVRLVTAIPVSK